MKGKLPRLFQKEITPTDESKSFVEGLAYKKTEANHSNVIFVPTSQGRENIRLGDPLGALDSPTNSPPRDNNAHFSVKSTGSPLESSRNYSSHINSKDSDQVPYEVTTPTSSDLHMLSNSPLDNKVLKSSLDLKISTIRATHLQPLPVPDFSPSDQNSSELTPCLLPNDNTPIQTEDLKHNVPESFSSPVLNPVSLPKSRSMPDKSSSLQPKAPPTRTPVTSRVSRNTAKPNNYASNKSALPTIRSSSATRESNK